MPDTFYRIKEKYATVTVNDQYTIMASEQDSVILQAPLAIQLLEVINTTQSTRESIVANYQEYSNNLSEVLLTLHQLEAEGYITQSIPFFNSEQIAYWEELEYNTEKLVEVFKTKPIRVEALGGIDTISFKEACTSTGITFSTEPYITVVLTSDYLHPDLEKINQEMITNNSRWLLVKLQGTTPYIGPLFNPKQQSSACWKCLEHRLLLHDQENKLYQALAKTNIRIARPTISHPITEQWGISTVISELVSLLYHEKNTALENNLIALSSKTFERTVHTVVKRPQCEACGSLDMVMQHPNPIELQPQKTITNHQGGYRTVTPETTLQKYKHHVSNITGVVPYLKKYHPVNDVPIYNFGSGKNMALQSSSLFWLNLHLRSANGGKGKTEIQAKTGALCEAIERYSLMYQGAAHTISATYHQLENKIDPNECMLYSNAQYENRERINKQSTKFYSLIPIPFDRDKEMDWTPVYNITKQKFTHLPSCYCYAQYPAENENKLYAYPDSNGCAAGNTIEEAILQGFLELIERDAAAIWWYNRLQYPAVDLATSNNEYIDLMVAYYQSINRSLYVLDITTDMEIPVFVAISHNLKKGEKDQILYAFGAHIDANIALERSIVELNQLLPVVMSNGKEYLTTDIVFVDWLNEVSLKESPYLTPLQDTKKNMQTDYPLLCKANVYDSVGFCIEIAQKNNLDTLVVDLTQPDIGLPVAKVIVPGLRHFWRRTAPGRLFEVPIKIGKLKQPYTEEELNPLSIFI